MPQRPLGDDTTDALIDAAVRLMMGRRPRAHTAAVGSTGSPCTGASRYYLKRVSPTNDRSRTHPRAGGKAGLLIDTANHLALGIHCSRGPRPSDDSASNHAYLRDDPGITSTIPTHALGKTPNHPARDPHR